MATKHAVEVGEVIEAARKGDFANWLGSFSKVLAGIADSDLVEKSRIGLAGACNNFMESRREDARHYPCRKEYGA
jgi:hypothetical protein